MADKTVVQDEQVITDPFEYGYDKNTKVVIDGSLFASLMQFAGGIAQREAKEKILVNTFSAVTGPKYRENGTVQFPEPMVQIFTTPEGHRAEILFEEAMEAHMENIKKGVASIIGAPSQLDLG